MALLPWNRRKAKADYKLGVHTEEEDVGEMQKISELTHIFDITPTSSGFIRPDYVSTSFQAQQFSIDSENTQHYMIDFGKLRFKREYFSISRVSMTYFGLYQRDSGIISIKLVNSAYKDPTKQIEFEGRGCVGSMWGLVSGMGNSIHSLDFENLFIKIDVNNSDVRDSVLGELYILWEFTYTDIPIQYFKDETICFTFKPLTSDEGNFKMAQKTWDIYKTIADRKKTMKSLHSVMNSDHITLYKPTEINLETLTSMPASSSVNPSMVSYPQVPSAPQLAVNPYIRNFK